MRKRLSEVKAAAEAAAMPEEITAQLEPTLTPKEKRAQYTVRIRPSVYQRLRNCAEFTPGKNLTDLLELSIVEYLERREAEHGGPFPEV